MSRARHPAVARFAAPAAFLLAATIAVLLVRSALDSGDGSPAVPAPATATAPTGTVETATGTTETATATRAQPEVYVIRPGDTLLTIAEEHDTTVERLLELNPGIDPVALTVGQRIRVG